MMPGRWNRAFLLSLGEAMRSDMAKVICERPRTGGDGGKSKPPKGTQKRTQQAWKDDGEGFRKQESTARRRVYGYDAKEFGELLGPLRGFLLSRVGHKWDDVYSEVCQHINRDNIVQKHILTHLFDYIALNVRVEKGKVYYNEPQRYYRDKFPYEEISEETYRHPVTGIITKYKKKQKKYRRQTWRPDPGTYIYESKDKCYVKDASGIWWGCELRAFGEAKLVKHYYLDGKSFWWNTEQDEQFDVLLKKEVSRGSHILYKKYATADYYCWRKQQVNKRKIRQLEKLFELDRKKKSA